MNKTVSFPQPPDASEPPPDRKPMDFFIPAATDEQGHSERASVRLPPYLMGEVGELVASRRFPYRTSSDLLRHALVQHLRALAREDSDYRSDWARMEILLKLLESKEQDLKTAHVIDGLTQTLSKLEGLGALGEAVRLLAEVRHIVSGMHNEYWRQMCSAHLDRFNYLHSRLKKVQLTHSEEIKRPLDFLQEPSSARLPTEGEEPRS